MQKLRREHDNLRAELATVGARGESAEEDENVGEPFPDSMITDQDVPCCIVAHKEARSQDATPGAIHSLCPRSLVAFVAFEPRGR